MKIHLITLAAFPFASAESIHLALFSKAMASLCEFSLVTPIKFWRPKTASLNISARYGIPKESIRQVKMIQTTRSGEDFVRKAVGKACTDGALIYARQESVIREAHRRGARCVWEIHSLPNKDGLDTIRTALSSGSLIQMIVISEALRSDLIAALELDGLDSKILLARDAADISRFALTPLARENPAVGYLGSAYPGKGCEIIVPLARICSEISFVFFGATRRELTERFGNLPANLKVMGKVRYSEIASAMAKFDIALLPNQPSVLMSNGDDIGRYTSPMKLFEYMAAGKAILGSDLPIIREVLEQGHTAILVPHDRIDQWAVALRHVCSDFDLRDRLSKNAYSKFLEKFTYQARARDVLSALSEG